MFDLKGKTAVITGASGGIGKAIALQFAGLGANVAILYNSSAERASQVKVQAEACGVKAEIYACDVSKAQDVNSTIAKVLADFTNVDILVNNAGITRDALIMQMSEDDFDTVIAANLKGAFNTIKALSRHFIKRRAGRIINITSVSGMMGNAGQANYSSSKAGLIGLTKTAAKEFASRGITCNAIAPGFIETEMTAKMPENILEAARETIPLKRLGKPDEIASLCAFLASDCASYITGEIIKADGGLYI